MIKIDKIIVKNFKNIENAELTLGNFNVLVGQNGSGKTNFMQVISFLNFLVNGNTQEVKDYFLGGVNAYFGYLFPDIDGNNNLEIAVTIMFSENNTLYNYEIKIEKYDSSSSLGLGISEENFSYKEKSKTGKAINIFHRKGGKVKINDKSTIFKGEYELANYTSVVRVLNSIISTNNTDIVGKSLSVFNNILKIDILYFFSKNILQEENEKSIGNIKYGLKLADEIDNIKTNGNNSIYHYILKDILNIDSISVFRDFQNKNIVYAINITQYDMLKSISQLSDGTILILALITKVLNSQKSIFFIEEPENSIHPKALHDLINFLKSFGDEKQFLISTHSSNLLNMVQPEQVFVAHIQENGMSNIAGVKNVKELRKRLTNSFTSLGDLLINNIDEETPAFEEYE